MQFKSLTLSVGEAPLPNAADPRVSRDKAGPSNSAPVWEQVVSSSAPEHPFHLSSPRKSQGAHMPTGHREPGL